MDNDSKLRVVSNIDERIERVLNDLNAGVSYQKTDAADVLEMFNPDAIQYKKYFMENSNSQFVFKHFSIPYLIEREGYKNYLCHTYLVIMPKGFDTFLEGLSFYSFESDGFYQDFVRANERLFSSDAVDKRNLERFIESMGKKGKILLLFHSTYIYHQRIDGKSITRKIVNPVPCLGEFYQDSKGVYQFRTINSELEDEIIILADEQIELENGEVKLKLERRNGK